MTNARKSKELRAEICEWFSRGLNNEGIARTLDTKIRKVRREDARLRNKWAIKAEIRAREEGWARAITDKAKALSGVTK